MTEAAQLHRQVEEAFNKGDVDGLVALYEPDARLVRDDGSPAVGHDEIRAFWQGTVALGGQIRLKTRGAVEVGEIALLSNEWTFEASGFSLTAISAEVARRQPDGRWLYVIDNPQGGSQPTS